MVCCWSETAELFISQFKVYGTEEAIAKWQTCVEEAKIYMTWAFFHQYWKHKWFLAWRWSHRWTGLRWHMKTQKWVSPSERQVHFGKTWIYLPIVGSLHTILYHSSIWFLCQIALIQLLVVWFSTSSNTVSITHMCLNAHVYGSIYVIIWEWSKVNVQINESNKYIIEKSRITLVDNFRRTSVKWKFIL